MKKRNLIGTNLKNIRRHNNLSQEQLIAQLNLLGLDLNRTSLSRIENHNREVNVVLNLVLSFKSCNRCENGKFTKFPDPDSFLQKLYYRNEYFIDSPHPLSETLIHQTGKNNESRRKYLNDKYNLTLGNLLVTWRPLIIHE